MFYWTHRETLALYDAFFVTTDASKLPSISGGASTPSSSPNPSTSTPSTSGEKYKQFKAEGGSVLFEAEDASINKDLVGVVEAKSASGEKGVRMNKDDRNIPAKDAKAGIDLRLLLTRAATIMYG